MKSMLNVVTNNHVSIFLIGALLSALSILCGGVAAGDVLLFSLAAFIISLTPLLFSKKNALIPCRVISVYQPLVSRKDLTHRNDPLLM